MITTADEVTLRAVDQNAPVQAADCLSFPATLNLSTEQETVFVKEGAEATQANKSVGATDDDRDSQQEVPSPTPITSTTTVYASVHYGISPFPYPSPGLKGVECLAVPPSKTAETLTILSQTSGIFLKGLSQNGRPGNEEANRAIRDTTLNSPRKRKPSAEPHEPCSVPVFHGSDDAWAPPRRPRACRSAPHLGKYPLNSRRRRLVRRRPRKI
jgi:hypothetical protein